jgi:hypothetical protein
MYLVAFTAATSEPHCQGTAQACAYLPKQETVELLGLGSTRAYAAANIRGGIALAGTLDAGRWALIVPDGVARVAFLFPRRDPITNVLYRRTLRITVPVHANVAAVQSDRKEYPVAATFYGATGELIPHTGQLGP